MALLEEPPHRLPALFGHGGMACDHAEGCRQREVVRMFG